MYFIIRYLSGLSSCISPHPGFSLSAGHGPSPAPSAAVAPARQSP